LTARLWGDWLARYRPSLGKCDHRRGLPEDPKALVVQNWRLGNPHHRGITEFRFPFRVADRAQVAQRRHLFCQRGGRMRRAQKCFTTTVGTGPVGHGINCSNDERHPIARPPPHRRVALSCTYAPNASKTTQVPSASFNKSRNSRFGACMSEHWLNDRKSLI